MPRLLCPSAAAPGFDAGRAPADKGLRYPADPPKVEEIVTVIRAAGDGAPAADGRVSVLPGGQASGRSEGPTLTKGPTVPGARRTDATEPAPGVFVGGRARHRQFRRPPRGGSMVAKFESDDPDAGREIFTGTVGK